MSTDRKYNDRVDPADSFNYHRGSDSRSLEMMTDDIDFENALQDIDFDFDQQLNTDMSMESSSKVKNDAGNPSSSKNTIDEIFLEYVSEKSGNLENNVERYLLNRTVYEEVGSNTETAHTCKVESNDLLGGQVLEECSNKTKAVVSESVLGTSVMFPVSPYNSQKSIMYRIINALQKAEHCLIESATGTGKTLVLLSSVLAWQNHMRAELSSLPINEGKVDEASGGIKGNATKFEVPGSSPVKTENRPGLGDFYEADRFSSSAYGSPGPSRGEFTTIKSDIFTEKNENEEEDDDIFKPKKIKIFPRSPFKTMNKQMDRDIKTENTRFTETGLNMNPQQEQPELQIITDEMFMPQKFNPRIPKIFYCSRTHKQIEQLVTELNKSCYLPNMTILSSRDNYCLHPLGQNSRNKNQMCSELRQPIYKRKPGSEYYSFPVCTYYMNRNRISSQASLKASRIYSPPLWDIEDMVSLGTERKACPYYASKELMRNSDVIFCPYNYLVDPMIRERMDINLKGNIVIFDEGHNLEDVCRELIGLSISNNQLDSLIDECNHVEYRESLPSYVSNYLSNLRRMIHAEDLRQKFKNVSHERSEYVMDISEFYARAESNDCGKDKFLQMLEIFRTMNTQNEETSQKLLSDATCSVLEDFIFKFRYLFEDNYREDFFVIIKRELVNTNSEKSNNKMEKHDALFRRKSSKFSLTISCMNPSILYELIKNEARTTIIASGTLSPMDSFESELKTKFSHIFCHNHLVSNSRLFVAALSNGPTMPLYLTKDRINQYNTQGDLGMVILQIANSVPDGMIVFFTSYILRDKLCERWQDIGVLETLAKRKRIFLEPRNLDDAQKEIEEYFKSVDHPSDEMDGAIFFAVFRGKLSEGTNWKNKYARTVVTVGIPYPDWGDNTVQLKIQYNDKKFKNSISSLNGSSWYKMQGFRALNQALGRVIRGPDDWGIMIMVDARLCKADLTQVYLTKWIHKSMTVYNRCDALIFELKKFLSRRKTIHTQQKQS